MQVILLENRLENSNGDFHSARFNNIGRNIVGIGKTHEKIGASANWSARLLLKVRGNGNKHEKEREREQIM